jgi:hypothetical protein
VNHDTFNFHSLSQMKKHKTAPAHTLGPWYCESDARGYRIFTAEGPKNGLIAKFSTFRRNPDWSREHVPKALLLAAAPELLERCEMCLADAEAALANPDEVADYNWQSIADDLRAVIAKAKGKAA